MLTCADILALIPHQGTMCLLDTVSYWDQERIAARSERRVSIEHPLDKADELLAIHLCEYGAQATAVHGGLLGRSQGLPPQPGMLVALRDVTLHVCHVNLRHADLEVTADCLLKTAGSSQYQFKIQQAGIALAEGRVAVIYSATTATVRS
jgi:predicted hotdog family 3-hydroxylacyl-ACP dehydratase